MAGLVYHISAGETDAELDVRRASDRKRQEERRLVVWDIDWCVPLN